MNLNLFVYGMGKGNNYSSILARELDCRKLTRDSDKISLQGKTVVNYGRSDVPAWILDGAKRVVNHPSKIGNSANKIRAFTLLRDAEVPTVPWTLDQEQAQRWLNAGFRVFVRTLCSASRGRGIIILEPRATAMKAPLYTGEFPKTHEFRVHVMNGECICYNQKKRMGKEKLEKLGLTEADMDIRNHGRGWVFARNDVLKVKAVENIAVDAVTALGLDFGACDILYDEESRMPVICEVNSAPSLFNSTLQDYANAIKKHYT